VRAVGTPVSADSNNSLPKHSLRQHKVFSKRYLPCFWSYEARMILPVIIVVESDYFATYGKTPYLLLR
jgi:hypothetical protein